MMQNQVAGNQGRAVGSSIAGKPQPFEKIPIFWSARTSLVFAFFLFFFFLKKKNKFTTLSF